MLFGVLGPVAVWTADGEPVPVPGRKVRALLAVLLLHEGRAVSGARLVHDLWGDDLPGNPAGTLSAKASQLRKALEDAEPGARRLVVSPPPGYRLRIDAGAVDAHRFRTLTAQARRTHDPRARVALLSDALALWRGPAFSDFADEPFVEVAAARLNEERLTALEEQAEARLSSGESGELVAELAELVAAHPLRERLCGLHMRALYLSGRQPEALAGYAALRARLADELGLDPGDDLVALHRAILTRDPSLDVAVLRTRPRSNLPAPLTDLVGRADDVSGIRSALGTARLVTLTGPGGVGKTRLATEVARGLVDAFDDGAWFAELGSLAPGSTSDAADVVMEALGVRDVVGEGKPSSERLVDALRTRRLLLVLDNCEHVVDGVAALAGRLLRAAPDLRILATSREPLGLQGEVVRGVPPLEVPEAVRLFTARASAAGFVLDASTAGAVEVLCRRLDGLPLALELAATRVRALGVHELVARLDDRFRLLAAGHRDSPARQQTLQAVIGWSWELLTEPERIVLRRLAVHADGCTIEAAEQVGAEDGIDVACLLARLVDRSLVSVVHHADGPRYRLLESVAAYCADRLTEAAETERIRERHGRYYTSLAERAAPGLYGPDQREWLRRLDAETANLRSALDRATTHRDAERALRLVVALTWYWFLRGRLVEAAQRLRAATALDGEAPAMLRARAAAWQAGVGCLLGERPDPAAEPLWEQLDDPAERGRAEWFLAYAEIDFGDVSAVEKRLERALTAFHEAGDDWGVAAALSTRARLGYLVDDLDAVQRDAGRSAALFRELGDRWGLAQATTRLGGRAEALGDHAEASRLEHEGLRMAEELGLWSEVSVGLGSLAWIAVQQRDHRRACDLAHEARRLAREQGYRVGEIFAELCLGFASRRRGDLDRAERYLTGLVRAAEPRQEGEPPPLYLPLVLTELGFLAEQRGDRAEARRLHLEGFTTARARGERRMVALALEGLAGAVGSAGQHRAAARLLGVADTIRRSVSVPAAPSERAEIDRIAAPARLALGEPGFTAAFEHGATLSPEDALARIA
ncbi:BTAD domain-containing putative transcriptional regulator [Pseudonocardia cypriaca]|nr:BTAD domain-containing putative transcriptional regulator [Pseudonocardia cypriaca]